MKILFSTDQTYLHGGIERVMATKANYFAQMNAIDVSVLTTEQKGRTNCYDFDDKIMNIDLEINYDRNSSYFSFVNIKKAWTHFLKQRKLIRKMKPDVIISINYNLDHIWLPFIKNKALLIKERHGSRFQEHEILKNGSFLSKMKLKWMDWIERRYDYIVVLNEDEAQYVRTNNAVVIPNPVSKSERIASLENKIVIAAGRLAPVKAFDELIQIWKLILLDFPDWQLHIYGDDYLNTKKELLTLIESLELELKVVLKGTTNLLMEKMADASIYAMTSTTECFPMVLLEAQSVGLPIVTYDCPNGPRNIVIDGEDGFLIPQRDRDLFAEKLRLLMSSDSLREKMGRAAKLNVSRFDVENIMKKWLSLLSL